MCLSVSSHTSFALKCFCSAGKLFTALHCSLFFLVSCHPMFLLASRLFFCSPRLFPRPGWREVSTMCWLGGEITQTGRGGSNPPDGQEVNLGVWCSWLEDGERGGVVEIREKDWEWCGGTGRSKYTCEANRKALRGLPAIVSTVYQMAFHRGRTLKETSWSPNKTE